MSKSKYTKTKVFVSFIALFGIVLIVIAPYLVSLILKGNDITWIGFYGSYLGAIIGGIFAYIVAFIQVKQSRDIMEAEKIEEESFTENLIIHFLHDEILQIIKVLEDTTTIGAIELYANGEQDEENYFIGAVVKRLNTDIFEEIKFELIKHNGVMIRDTISFYKIIKRLKNSNYLSDISREEAEMLLRNIESWKIAV